MTDEKDRWAYTFIAIAIKPEENVKKGLLDLCAPLFLDKDKTEIKIEDDTDRDGNPVWKVQLKIFDNDYARDHLQDLLALCKKAVHLDGVVTLVARLLSEKTTFMASAGDYWSGDSKRIMKAWDTLNFYHKEMIGKAPFYIYEVKTPNEM